ncbi:MAG: aminotransferase class IV [Planctomycetes bacterium]|nr:aminotransferase class IV [Planctomycetota bacterium]
MAIRILTRPMPTDFFALDGRVIPAAEATVSVLDLGFLRGVGAFETLRTYADGLPHLLGEHLRRIWESAAAFGLAPFFGESEVRRLISEIHRRSGHGELRVNLIVTPGENTSGVFGAERPTWVMIAREVHAPPAELYEQGVTAVTFAATRHLPTLKTTSYLVGKTGLLLADQLGAHEAFYVDPAGYVTEGVTSNLLVVRGGRVMTPVKDCLPGITKAGLRPVAEAAGLAWYECNLTCDDVYTADEVWITSAVRELLPVVQVDDRTIAQGVVGPWAKRLRPLYHQRCIAEARRDAAAAAAAAG